LATLAVKVASTDKLNTIKEKKKRGYCLNSLFLDAKDEYRITSSNKFDWQDDKFSAKDWM